MKLTENGLKNTSLWKKHGYELPCYDRAQMIVETKNSPYWIHFGAGNIFRAFGANIAETLLNKGILSKGVIVAEGYDYEIIEKMNHPHDNLSLLVTLKSDQTIEKKIIGSIAESLPLDPLDSTSFMRLKEIFTSTSLQIASFTITEKGYQLSDSNGEFYSSVATDFANGPQKAESYMGKISALLYQRFLSGKLPIGMVSMDNCSHNGSKLFEAILTFAKMWEHNHLVKDGFTQYINDPKQVSFPWTMIDKITPRPDTSIEMLLKEDQLEDLSPIITKKNTYVAPFVNAEECEYLVIEDLFPNGRPPLDMGGVIFTDRDTVEKVEKMKVCTCLNPLHTTLALFGCLLGYSFIWEEMNHPYLKKLVQNIGYLEGLPVVVHPQILDPKEFIDTVLTIRIPNPYMPDTPQRIATDTSLKLSVRFGETIKAYQASTTLSVSTLKYIPLVFAGWLRFLTGIDDQGNHFDLSPDPSLDRLSPLFTNLELGCEIDSSLFLPLLSNKIIFGVDLVSIGMSDLVITYFKEMMHGKNAVEATLKKYLSN